MSWNKAVETYLATLNSATSTAARYGSSLDEFAGWYRRTYGEMPDPDLLIRTAGEMRLSNFLLWQINYAELWVTETCWPEFDEPLLHDAIRDFASRDRRFGGLNND